MTALEPDPQFTLQQVYLHSYLHLLGITIFYYDYLLTFKDEYKRFWAKPTTRPSVMFFVNRYVTFFGDIVVNVGNFYIFKTEKSCKQYALYRTVLLVAAQVIVCVILCIRTYALYSCDWRILALVVGGGGILLVLSCWASFGQAEWVDITGGCHTALPWVTSVRTAVPWEALFLYDVMIFTLTLVKTVRERWANPISSGKFDLVYLIFRDGAIYFAVMASVNLGNVVTFYTVTPLLRGCLSTFASSVSVTMMSRLMLNLHDGMYGPGTSAATGVSTHFVFSSHPADGNAHGAHTLAADTFSFGPDSSFGFASSSGSVSGSRGVDSLAASTSFGIASSSGTGSHGRTVDTYVSEGSVREVLELQDLQDIHVRHRAKSPESV